jgi:hypothetical protein
MHQAKESRPTCEEGARSKARDKAKTRGIAKRGGHTKAKGTFVQRLAGTSFEELHCTLEKKL